MKYTLIRNISDRDQAVSGIPLFTAGAQRKVTSAEAEILLRNPNFEKVKKASSKSGAKTFLKDEEASAKLKNKD